MTKPTTIVNTNDTSVIGIVPAATSILGIVLELECLDAS